MDNVVFIIDFDSTFVTVEALDTLALIALKNNLQKKEILEQIKSLTQQGMDGKISFSDSLSKRLELFSPTQEDIKKLITVLQKNITPSVMRNKDFFQEYAHSIYIISGGFKEYINPIVKKFGIKNDHIIANTFIEKNGVITGHDLNNPLAKTHGKVIAVQNLSLEKKVIVVGDGITDYEIKEKGEADVFYAFTENISRDTVVQKADQEIKSFDELLYQLRLPRAFSYPKSRMKVLLLENIDQAAQEKFVEQGYDVEALPQALSEEELIEKIKDVTILGIRSKTEVTKNVLSAARRLLAIGAFCIGTNQIDLETCAQKGIIVFNAPYSNTRSVVELAIGEIIMLSRNVFDKSQKLHNGIWDKSAKGSHEIRGKKLGIIGYGSIGSQLSIVAEALGMEVYFFDTSEKLSLGNAHKCNSIEEVLKIADVITIHVDGRKSNTNLIGEKEFKHMKDGVLFINLSRGFIVDLDALSNALKTGKVRGAAVDVFLKEPKSNNEKFESSLQNIQNVILTPHIAGSTEEAQKDIGEFVAERIMNFIDNGTSVLSVNFPSLQLPEMKESHRLIHIHKNQPGVLAKINTIFAEFSINIDGQYLGTNQEIGFVITDIHKDYNHNLIQSLKKISETIKLRMLY